MLTPHLPRDCDPALKQALMELCAIVNAPANRAQYAFAPPNVRVQQTQELRHRLRVAFGYNPSNKHAGIRDIRTGSPLQKVSSMASDAVVLNNGCIFTKDAKFRLRPQQTVMATIECGRLAILKDSVYVYYDPSKISPEQINDIMYLKATGRLPKNAQGHGANYIKLLESLASYMIIRSAAMQYFDQYANCLEAPVLHQWYYGCFPKLTKPGHHGPTKDLLFFYGNHRLNVTELKQKFLDIISLHINVAAMHSEAIALVVPNAFLDGLSPQDMKLAKIQFIEAIAELVTSINAPGCRGLFVSVSEEHAKLLSSLITKGISIPTIINVGADATAPQRAATTYNLDIRIADCAMGSPIGPVGNGALSDYANQAKEENDTRQCLGTNVLTTSTAFNVGLRMRAPIPCAPLTQHIKPKHLQ